MKNCVLSRVTAARLLIDSPVAVAPSVVTVVLSVDSLAPFPLANRP